MVSNIGKVPKIKKAKVWSFKLKKHSDLFSTGRSLKNLILNDKQAVGMKKK